jgi:hypothetical protein
MMIPGDTALQRDGALADTGVNEIRGLLRGQLLKISTFFQSSDRFP